MRIKSITTVHMYLLVQRRDRQCGIHACPAVAYLTVRRGSVVSTVGIKNRLIKQLVSFLSWKFDLRPFQVSNKACGAGRATSIFILEKAANKFARQIGLETYKSVLLPSGKWCSWIQRWLPTISDKGVLFTGPITETESSFLATLAFVGDSDVRTSTRSASAPNSPPNTARLSLAPNAAKNRQLCSRTHGHYVILKNKTKNALL